MFGPKLSVLQLQYLGRGVWGHFRLPEGPAWSVGYQGRQVRVVAGVRTWSPLHMWHSLLAPRGLSLTTVTRGSAFAPGRKEDTVARNTSIFYIFFASHPLYTLTVCNERAKNITRRKVFFSNFSLVCNVLFLKKNFNFRTANRLMRHLRGPFLSWCPSDCRCMLPISSKLILRKSTAVKQFNLDENRNFYNPALWHSIGILQNLDCVIAVLHSSTDRHESRTRDFTCVRKVFFVH